MKKINENKPTSLQLCVTLFLVRFLGFLSIYSYFGSFWKYCFGLYNVSINSVPEVACEQISAKTIRIFREKWIIRSELTKRTGSDVFHCLQNF